MNDTPFVKFFYLQQFLSIIVSIIDVVRVIHTRICITFFFPILSCSHCYRHFHYLPFQFVFFPGVPRVHCIIFISSQACSPLCVLRSTSSWSRSQTPAEALCKSQPNMYVVSILNNHAQEGSYPFRISPFITG